MDLAAEWGELLRADFKGGAELHRQYAGIALRKELEIRNIAGGGPAPAQAVEAQALVNKVRESHSRRRLPRSA